MTVAEATPMQVLIDAKLSGTTKMYPDGDYGYKFRTNEQAAEVALSALRDAGYVVAEVGGAQLNAADPTDDERRTCGAHDDCSGTGPDCFDPNICSACDGEGCEEGCGRRLGCRDAYSGPDSHKVCPRCGGTGRVTSDSAKPVASLPNWPEGAA